MLKYILFDLDGTLTESAPGIINSIRYALRRLNLPELSDSELQRFIGPPLIDSFGRYCGLSREKALEATDVYREYFSEKGLFENSVYSGVPECLHRLKSAGLRLAVATSKPEVFARRIIEHFGLAGYFEVIRGIPLCDELMTKSQVIALALSELGVNDISEAIMVGDREHDVLGARENGLGCVGILYGYGSREELEGAGADYICETASDLADLLLKL